MKKLLQLVLMIMLVMGMSVASQAATITVGSATGDTGTQVSIPVTIDSTAGRLDCSFSVSFDNTKLEYAGKTSGDMGASLLVASTADINTAGKVQPIVTFEDGGATSGTITSFKFNIKTGAAAGATPLTIGDITPTGTFTGVSGSVTILPAPCTGATITVGTGSASNQGDTVEIPITIDDTNGQPDASFSVSFDKTKLEYTGTAAGTMDATILAEKVDEVNAAGKAQLIARFATGGATSGTIVKLKFTVLADLTANLPLTIGDIIPSDKFCGEAGAVEPGAPCDVTISPTTATVECRTTQQFTSTPTGTCGTLTWDVTSSIGSIINQNGLYIAGTNDTGADVTDTVKIKSSSDAVLASAVVTVPDCSPTTQCNVNIIPALATVDCGDTIEFNAVTTGSGCATPVYNWNVVTTIGSTITETGHYTAGQNDVEGAGDAHDVVNVQDTANNKFDTSNVTIGNCFTQCFVLTAEPATSAQGQTLKVKLSTTEEMFKNVDKKDILVDFGEGITVVTKDDGTIKISDKDKNSITVQIIIDANARLGSRTVRIDIAGETEVCASGPFTVTLAPTISIIPPIGRAGEEEKMDITINGQRTHFAQGKTKVKFGDKIEVDNVTVVDANTITLKIKIKDKAVTGSRSVTVSTKIGNNQKEVVIGTFIVLPATTQE